MKSVTSADGTDVAFERFGDGELVGGASHPFMLESGRELAEALPDSEYRVLEGQQHAVPPEVMVPVLAEFLAC